MGVGCRASGPELAIEEDEVEKVEERVGEARLVLGAETQIGGVRGRLHWPGLQGAETREPRRSGSGEQEAAAALDVRVEPPEGLGVERGADGQDERGRGEGHSPAHRGELVGHVSFGEHLHPAAKLLGRRVRVGGEGHVGELGGAVQPPLVVAVEAEDVADLVETRPVLLGWKGPMQ